MRRFFQFRLRALFVLVTLAAIAALWWSHRLHCLTRAAFHRSEIIRCEEQQVRELDLLETALVQLQSKIDERIANGRRTSRGKRWEDQSIYDAMDQGFLIIPAPNSPPNIDTSQPENPEVADLDATAKEEELENPLAIYDAKVAALEREITLHRKLADQYQRATYRPWMRVDESGLAK